MVLGYPKSPIPNPQSVKIFVMLTELYIENFALIDKLTVAFAPGLNVLTGETGAGKSIVIDAINVLLGERAGTELVRTGMPRGGGAGGL